MSELSEKLEQRRPSSGGKATATLTQLLKRWGSRAESADRVVINSMGRREVWRRVSGDVFEQVDP